MSNKQHELRILHIIPSVSPKRGGPSKAIIDMVSALRKSGTNAEIETTNDDGDELLDVPIGNLIQHRGVPTRFFKRTSPKISALREFAYCAGFARWLKNNIANYDLIHVHAIFSYCSSRAMQIARKHNIPYVVRPIGQLEQWSLTQSRTRKIAYLKLFEKQNLEFADCVQFTSRSEQHQALELLPKLTSDIIPLGLELPMRIRQAKVKMEQRWNLQRDVPTLLFLSRLHKKKGLELLLKALAKQPNQDYQLVIAGEGDRSYTQSLQTLTEQLGLKAACRYVGFVKGAEKKLLLQGADLYTLTSHSENFGIAVLEAMASGTSVLISDQVALSKQVEENKLGFVTELSIEHIQAQLENALEDIDQTQELGRHARTYVKQHFQWSHIAKQLNQLYHSLAS